LVLNFHFSLCSSNFQKWWRENGFFHACLVPLLCNKILHSHNREGNDKYKTQISCDIEQTHKNMQDELTQSSIVHPLGGAFLAWPNNHSNVINIARSHHNGLGEISLCGLMVHWSSASADETCPQLFANTSSQLDSCQSPRIHTLTCLQYSNVLLLRVIRE
jgi:hypothetical protein